MRSKRDDKQGLSYELAELVEMALFETGSPITQGRPQETADTLWTTRSGIDVFPSVVCDVLIYVIYQLLSSV